MKSKTSNHTTKYFCKSSNLNDENWHKLVDDGYICDHLTWHMEKAGSVDSIHQLLQEETDSKRNGWYLKCESLGKTAIFVGDVARAWKLAEAEYETNPSRAISLQCRYSLITSSLNTIAANIPPELISVLVEKKVWTTAQGLAYSRQVKSLSQQVLALRKLALYLPENLVPEALEAARNIGSESYRAEGLSTFVPNIHKMFDSFPYDFWCELIHSLASLKRRELLNKIDKNSHIIKELGSSETFREIANAIADVGRWFP